MVPTTALVPVVLLLALGADAAPSQDRRSWGNRRQGTRVLSARAAATTTTRANGDLQTFNQGLGSVYAPPVTASNGQFYQSNVPYYFLYDALVASCNQQSNNCATSSAVAPLDKVNCYGSQSLACISNAQTAANAYSASAGAAASSSAKAYSSSAAAFSSSAAAYSSSSAAAYSASASAASANAVSWSSSVASANYAKATQARSAAGDVQTFTGALGGIAAPAVTASGSKWISSGVTYNFLKDALDGSCYWQMNACQLAANNGGNKLELTVANCNGPQIQACLGAETAIISAQGAAATSSAAAWSASQSAQAYSASQSAQAYSASQSAQAYSASASAYSYSSSVSAAAAKASSAPVSSTSKPASSSSASSSAAPTSSAASSGGSSTTTAGNFQAFTGAIGGAAPAVTQNSQGQFVQSGITYGSLLTALQQSCYFQQNTCGTSSSVSDKTPCYTSQINACLTSAQSLSDSYTKSAVSYSSSVASANYAAATAARTVAGDVQSFTGAVGGIAAPAVTGSLQNWWSNNIYYYNLIDALSASCYYQQAQCNAKVAQNGGDSYEVTIDNCNNVQLNACLNNAKSVVSNYGKSSSSAPASSTSSSSAANTASASAYSASSLAAYSSSVNAANNAQAQQSASAYSQSSASAYSASSAAAYSQSVQNAQNAQAQQSASAYSASSASAYSQSSAAAYSQSVQNAQAQQSASAYSASSASAYSQSSAAAYSQSVQNAQAQQSASAYSQSSLAAYSQSVQNAQAQQSASAYSASSASAYSQSSAAAYSQSVQNAQAQQSAAAYSASSAAAAYSASVSAAAYSASSAAAAAVPTGLPSGWSQASTACIAEGTTGRALISDATFGNDMTWAKCTSYCDSKGYPLAGIEYSSECYCGNVLSNGASLNRPSAQCTMNAAGSNGQQIGGGPNALTLFVSNKLDTSKYTADLSGMIAQIPNGWTSTTGDSGICIIEGNTGRALAAASFAADDMTIAKCINFCSGKGMQYAGLEYSRECYCGNDLVNGASKDKTASCNMQCAGAPGTICGGPALLSVYQSPNLVYTATSVNGFQHQGCIQEVAGRALNQLSTVGNDMSIEKCTSFCAQNGYSFAGLEYASECYCGNSLANGATLGAFSTQCNMQCSGNNQETCGGPNAITLYATQQGLALVGA